MNKKFLFVTSFVVSALAAYAIRSYTYQKEVKAYINGVKAVVDAMEKAKKEKEKEND